MTRRDGYIVDVPYPLHFYKEMQPVWLAYIASSLGCVAPDLSRPYAYCELGCGGGINLLVAAACNPLGRFVGVDFNAQHIAAAQAAARRAGIGNVDFVEASFDAFCARHDGRFDFIVSHGVWSWLPPKARMGILQTVQERLNAGGMLYLQYMCYPGAARLISLQKLLYEVSRATPGDSRSRVGKGMALLRQMADAGAGLFVDNPEIERELAALEKVQPAYLAHDYLTDHWQPQHSADVHRVISQVGVDFIGSANCFENMDSLSIPGNVQPLLASAASRALRETMRDTARNQSQRVDVFQRRARALSPEEHLWALDRIVFKALPKMPLPGAIEFKTPIGRVPGPEEIFAPLMRHLSAGPCAFADLRRLPAFVREPGLLLQALSMLMWAEYVHPTRPDEAVAASAGGLQGWVSEQALPLSILPDCGTAVLADPG